MRPAVIDSPDKDSLKPLVEKLLAQIDQLLEQNKSLLARIATLEGGDGKPPQTPPPKTPTNSSLPPSSARKANVAEPGAAKKKRKGRPGVTRELCPNPDVTRDIYAKRCACGTTLSPADQPDCFDYDHIDVPKIKPITTRINPHNGNARVASGALSASRRPT